jgi:hypothetical protein
VNKSQNYEDNLEGEGAVDDDHTSCDEVGVDVEEAQVEAGPCVQGDQKCVVSSASALLVEHIQAKERDPCEEDAWERVSSCDNEMKTKRTEHAH